MVENPRSFFCKKPKNQTLTRILRNGQRRLLPHPISQPRSRRPPAVTGRDFGLRPHRAGVAASWAGRAHSVCVPLTGAARHALWTSGWPAAARPTEPEPAAAAAGRSAVLPIGAVGVVGARRRADRRAVCPRCGGSRQRRRTGLAIRRSPIQRLTRHQRDDQTCPRYIQVISLVAHLVRVDIGRTPWLVMACNDRRCCNELTP